MHPTLPVAPGSRGRRPLERLGPPRPVDVLLDKDALAAGLHLDTCPQCGANPAGTTPPRTLQWVSPFIWFAFLISLIVVVILHYTLRVRVTTALPLCADCAAADRRGRRLAALGLLGVVLGPVVLGAAGTVVGAGGVGAAVGLVAGLVGAVTAQVKLAPQMIVCRRIDAQEKTVTLRASPTWRSVLEREQPEALR